MQTDTLTATKKKGLYYGWWVILAVVAGLAAASGPVVVFTFGVFLKPLIQEFGWQRGEISLALTLHMLTIALCSPLVGKLVDRMGSRRFILPIICLFCLCFAAMSFLPGSIWLVYAFFIVLGVAGAGVNPTAYARTVCAWFDRQRGLALGLSMAGIGIGTVIMPPIAQTLITSLGWRNAYIALAVIAFLISFPLVYFFFRDPPKQGDMPSAADEDETAEVNISSTDYGLNKYEAIRRPEFRILLVAFFFTAMAINGSSVHLIPMLTDKGVDAEFAVMTASFMGAALLFGRVGAGYLLDKFFAPYITILFLSASMIGMLVLTIDGSKELAVFGAICLGLGLGAEVDIMGYLVSRYFGIKSFAEIYGYQFGVFILGSGLGPFIMGLGHDKTGAYNTILIAYACAMALVCLLLFRLGPYPKFKGRG